MEPLLPQRFKLFSDPPKPRGNLETLTYEVQFSLNFALGKNL